MIKDLPQHVIDEFGSPLAQEFYAQKAEEGLWPAEEILIKKYFPAHAKILDLGCGTGRTTMPLSRMGYDVVGVDITPAMIENAQRIAESHALSIRYEIGDATHLKFPDNSFDAILFSNNGWTQIPEKDKRLKALQEMRRVLRPDGMLMFTAHVRSMRGYFFFWIMQWMKMYILKPLGIPINEIEFGDRFFERETSGTGTHYRQKQFIHIPRIKDVQHQLAQASLTLVMRAPANDISGLNPARYSPMCYVCKA
jgi:ubiquinone/menaquinone biosynthesis C-methylase UbiE